MTETLLSESKPDLTDSSIFEAELAKLEANDEPEDTADEVAKPTEDEEQEAPIQEQDTVAAQDDEDPIPNERNLVPYSALKQKTAKIHAAEARALQAETKLEMLIKALEAKNGRETEITSKTDISLPDMTNPYDINVQPVEYLAREVEIAKEETKAIKAVYAQDKKITNEQRQIQNIFAQADADIASAVKSGSIPDADARAAYVLQSKAKEFSMFAENQEQTQEMVRNYSIALAARAKSQGKSIADAVKEISETMGYQPKAKEVIAKPNGQTRDIDAIAKNKAKSSSLSATGGNATLNGTPTTIKAALNKNGKGTNDEEFYRMLDGLKS